MSANNITAHIWSLRIATALRIVDDDVVHINDDATLLHCCCLSLTMQRGISDAVVHISVVVVYIIARRKQTCHGVACNNQLYPYGRLTCLLQMTAPAITDESAISQLTALGREHLLSIEWHYNEYNDSTRRWG